MNPIDRIVGPALPANRLRRVEERRREKDPRGERQPSPPRDPAPRKPAGDGPGTGHQIDELA
jgi:hypothetical protein